MVRKRMNGKGQRKALSLLVITLFLFSTFLTGTSIPTASGSGDSTFVTVLQSLVERTSEMVHAYFEMIKNYLRENSTFTTLEIERLLNESEALIEEADRLFNYSQTLIEERNYTGAQTLLLQALRYYKEAFAKLLEIRRLLGLPPNAIDLRYLNITRFAWLAHMLNRTGAENATSVEDSIILQNLKRKFEIYLEMVEKYERIFLLAINSSTAVSVQDLSTLKLLIDEVKELINEGLEAVRTGDIATARRILREVEGILIKIRIELRKIYHLAFLIRISNFKGNATTGLTTGMFNKIKNEIIRGNFTGTFRELHQCFLNIMKEGRGIPRTKVPGTVSQEVDNHHKGEHHKG